VNLKFVPSVVSVLGPELGASVMFDTRGVTLCVYAWRRLLLFSLYWGDK